MKKTRTYVAFKSKVKGYPYHPLHLLSLFWLFFFLLFVFLIFPSFVSFFVVLSISGLDVQLDYIVFLMCVLTDEINEMKWNDMTWHDMT